MWNTLATPSQLECRSMNSDWLPDQVLLLYNDEWVLDVVTQTQAFFVKSTPLNQKIMSRETNKDETHDQQGDSIFKIESSSNNLILPVLNLFFYLMNAASHDRGTWGCDESLLLLATLCSKN